MFVKPKDVISILFSTSSTSAGASSGVIRISRRYSPSCLNPIIPSLLRKCRSLRYLESAHAALIKHGSDKDAFFVNQFVAACSRHHQMGYALQLFAQMTKPNIFVYNAVIGGLVRHSESGKGLELYLAMLRSDVPPNEYTFSFLVKACAQLPAVELGKAVHGQILKAGFGEQLLVQTVLLNFYSSSDEIVEARKLFEEMTERDVVSWTAMIHGHACVGDLLAARKLFDDMPERTVVSWNTMIAGYARARNVESAISLFNEMPEKNLVSWTTMISCYSQNKQYSEAIETFQVMKAAGVDPDEVTMAATLSACAHLGALDVGRELHLYAMLNGFDHNVHVGSALTDMYAKCGDLEKALVTFYKLEKKNIFCWNSIIEGLGIHGCGWDAINMFQKMTEEGKSKPNGVTFVSLLGACNHAALVEEARRLFLSMMKDYAICPEVEHYGCMVDLLARTGNLKEALDLIRNMPIEPNAAIWLALLSGCKIHRGLEITEIAAEKLLVLEPDNSAHYMLLVNIFADTEAWDKVETVRRMMKEKQVQKSAPGCSWIDIDGEVTKFAACDAIHHSLDVGQLLIGLDRQIKFVGCSPEWASSSLI